MSDVLLLVDAYENFFRPQRLMGRSPKTHHQYMVNLGHLENYLGRPATVSDLTDENLSAVMSWQLDRGRCEATANKCRAHLVALWRFLARKGIVSIWPDVPAIREPERIPRAWTQQQLATLFAACRNQVGMIGPVKACRWWFALHCMAWDTAERINAILAIEWRDVDLDQRWVLVRAETRKGRTGDKLSRLHARTIEALKAIKTDDGKVFPWPYSLSNLWLRYSTLLRRAGLPTDRKSKFHRLRKSVATHLKVAGGNPTEALDHSSSKTTQAYIDPTIAVEIHPADLLFRPEEWQLPHGAG